MKKLLVVLTMLLVVLWGTAVHAAYTGWKYNTGDLYGANAVQERIDDLDDRLNAIGLTNATSHLIPAADDTYDLGSVAVEWRDVYIDGILNVDTITNSADIIFARALTALTITGDLTANGNIVCDGSTILTNLGTLYMGAVQWDDGSDQIDGEQIADDTIDGDAIDFTEVTGADLTLTDCTAIMASGDITANGDLFGDGGTIVSNMAAVYATTYFVGTTEGVDVTAAGVTNFDFSCSNGLVTAFTAN